MSGPYEESPSRGIDSEDDLQTGTQFGRFRVERILGSGGMATVYLADMLGAGGFSRPVALKLIHTHLAHNRTFRTGFVNEARLGGTLLHPNLVSTLDFGEDDGRMFMALEYVDGCTVSDLSYALRRHRRPMPLSILLTILIQVCRALEYAHKARDREGRPLNLVHRDVKPSNIMVDRFGGVKLGDFGVARAAMNLEQTEVTGIVKGSLRYMSPEQAMGLRTIDARSDLFSLTIVAYELFTQTRLYDAPNDLQGLRMAQDAQVEQPLRRLYDLQDGEELLPLLRRGLAREPEDRFASAAELRLALESVLSRTGAFPLLDEAWLHPILHEIDGAEPEPALSDVSLGGPVLDTSLDQGLGRTSTEFAPIDVEATEVQKPARREPGVLSPVPLGPPLQVQIQASVQEPVRDPVYDSSAQLAWAVGSEPDLPQPPATRPEGLSAQALHLLSRPEIDLTGIHAMPAAAVDAAPPERDAPLPFAFEEEWSLSAGADAPLPDVPGTQPSNLREGIQWDLMPNAESPFERVAQLRVLLQENPESAAPILREMANHDPDRNVREFCRRELTRLVSDGLTPGPSSPLQDGVQRAIQLVYLLYAILFLVLGLYLLILQPAGDSQAGVYLLRYARERPFLNLIISGLCFWATFESSSRTGEAMLVKALALVPILFSYPLGPIIGPGLMSGLYLQYRDGSGDAN